MNNETENTSKISDSTCKVAPETNATFSADAPEQAPKQTLKQAVCSIVEILEQMKEQITPDGEDYLALEINNASCGSIRISFYSRNAADYWCSPEFKSLEDVEAFDFSEKEIAGFFKSKIKTPAQVFKEAIEKMESDLAKLKAKLAEIEEEEAENGK